MQADSSGTEDWLQEKPRRPGLSVTGVSVNMVPKLVLGEAGLPANTLIIFFNKTKGVMHA